MLALPPGAAAAEPFSYFPAGYLAPGSGTGRADHVVYAPSMRFPLEEGPAFANSQVYSKGGAAGPRGGQCDPDNYAYPWRDNYCETRSWAMPLCPSGAGHQGQDLRPPTCEAGKYWVVAAADGAITHVGRYSVYLTDEHGTRYEYLHMSDVQVSPGDTVSRGQRIGRLSNVFGDKTTTIHLHFNLRQFVRGVGTVHVPPYTSLVAAYQALLNSPPEGALEVAGCEGIRGWTRDPDAHGAPASARLYFDGAATDPSVEGYTFVAERPAPTCASRSARARTASRRRCRGACSAASTPCAPTGSMRRAAPRSSSRGARRCSRVRSCCRQGCGGRSAAPRRWMRGGSRASGT
jgi:murein DD-endopeptidase MepM/ murein hydrolase activator NlpD